MNDDKNYFGRFLALALILGAAYAVHSIARGVAACPLGGGGSTCVMEIPAAPLAPAVDEKAAPVEKAGQRVDSDDEDAKLEKKAPVVPPANPK